jgi:hypothetical protein
LRRETDVTQSAATSAKETTVQMVVGFVVSLAVWMFAVTPLLGIPAPPAQAIWITGLFTITSWLRSFLVRRWFSHREGTKT